jgi:hypothetical protein
LNFSHQELLPNTNATLELRHQTPATEGEILGWFGIRLAMSLESVRGPVSDYWAQGNNDGTIFQNSDYGTRFKMSIDSRTFLKL